MHPGAIAAATPDKPAVIMAESGQVITFRELNEESNRLAHLFRAAGLRPGDNIAFMLENHPQFLTIAWAAHRSGLYYTAINSKLKTDELAYIVNNCNARVFISSARLAEVAASITEATPGVELRLMLDGTAPGFTSFEEAIARHPVTPIEDECQGADMLYSSGTTGRPKGVKPELTKAPLEEPGPLMKLIGFLFQPTAESVYLSPAPLYHAAPLRYCMTFHRFGATVVVMERFDPEQALALIEKYRVTHSQWVPTMFIKMLKLPAEVRERYDLSSHKYAVHAAAPCPVEVKERMMEWWGPILHEYYAGTEGNGFVYAGPQEWLSHKGTVGRPLLGVVHILDEDGNELPPRQTGTIYFSDGPQFVYHDDPEKTRAAQDPKGRGWTTLGDIGYVDEEGYLYLTDRRAYMIISGGVNIYPQEAENVLALHPKVADVAVIGVPDPEMGEQVKAVVQPVSMADAGPELEAELIEYCRARLAHYKCPKSVDFREELPRHPTGKLYKRLLRDEYWAAARR
ncbi:acyl-CoA synthetase [Thermobispora bispora]|uniref:AMP-dependent synthetase and ligase n=1 Tax=Thermobispora bispora (strain ATCC 19993 / DSM 43833 / CBS 139.67 / JCM 10125 / KCTC 9307 / NBRC 14880 / R51) TaxID=469371 RepID=D6YBQ7_THEBD|nr:acyl-CoA synthetase [Thermobispora bispora]ADG88617.1 AMP-dependent synthetase and ligase [Thermobispora bispora DSM 43833]MBO2475752.1 acyl-CoA synthetase [Actinomycetales bacterium]MBX6167170.1 acyl-CoA synthetase [Thermobispora bispora]MDI9579180.1 acyl-CoA synthetase [Thermobispora sp.]